MISCLFTTYDRSFLLKEKVGSLRRAPSGPASFAKVVLSDDHSRPEHLEVIRTLGFDVLTPAAINLGFGADCDDGTAPLHNAAHHARLGRLGIHGTAANMRHAIDALKEDHHVSLVQS